LQPEIQQTLKRGYVGVGLAALVRRSGSVLLIQRLGAHGNGQWTVPGGWMEQNETPKEGVARELFEEVGLTIEPDHFSFMNYVHTVHPEGISDITLWFVTDHLSHERLMDHSQFVLERDKIADVGWFSREELYKGKYPGEMFPPFIHQLNIGRI
jgi:8-oxo-dGTP diphosphatase